MGMCKPSGGVKKKFTDLMERILKKLKAVHLIQGLTIMMN